MKKEEKLITVSVSPYKNSLEWLISICITVAIVSGEYSISKINELTSVGIPDVKVATIAIALGFLGILITGKKNSIELKSRTLYAGVAGVFICLYFAVISVWSLNVWNNEFSGKFIRYILAMVLLYWQYLRIGRSFTTMFSIVSLVISMAWASSFYIGLFQHAHNQEIIKFGSAYSFYKTMLIGAFSALYLWTSCSKVKFLWLVIAGVLLISSFGSGSKAAWLVGTIAISILIFIQLTWFNIRNAIALSGWLVVCVIVSYSLFGSVVSARIENVVAGTGYKIDFNQNDKEIIKNENSKIYNTMNYLFGNSDANLYINDSELNEKIKNFKDRTVVLYDLSYRIRMLKMVIDDKPKLFGNGFGSYRLYTNNMYTKAKEVYTYPHNIIAEVLYTTGICGLALFMLAITMQNFVLLNAKERIKNSLPFFCLALALLIGSLFAGDIVDFSLYWCFMLIATGSLSSAPYKNRVCEAVLKN